MAVEVVTHRRLFNVTNLSIKKGGVFKCKLCNTSVTKHSNYLLVGIGYYKRAYCPTCALKILKDINEVVSHLGIFLRDDHGEVLDDG